MGLQHGDLALTCVRRFARQAVVEHAAEGVDVGPPVERLAADLLGTAVVDRAEERPGVGHAPRARALREPEVAQIRVPVGLGEQDVRGLEVAMDQAPPRARHPARRRSARRFATCLPATMDRSPGSAPAGSARPRSASPGRGPCRSRPRRRSGSRAGGRATRRAATRAETGRGSPGRRRARERSPSARHAGRVVRAGEKDRPHPAAAEDGLDRVRPELVADVHGQVRSR